MLLTKQIEDGEGQGVLALGPLFFMSGFAALVYQVCWQRLLFAVFGIDIDSVTLIVSAFMLGLGLGALLGGQLADRIPLRSLQLFAGTELGIGVFGWFSADLIRGTSALFVQAEPVVMGCVVFLLLLVPTSLMGATLPILVAHVTRRWRSVGRSIGFLYQMNTLGAALGVLTVGFLWFLIFDLDEAIKAAAVTNVLISLSTAIWVRRHA